MNFYGLISNFDLLMSFNPVIVSLIKKKKKKKSQLKVCGISGNITRLNKILHSDRVCSNPRNFHLTKDKT